MRVWIYGRNPEQIQRIKDSVVHSNDVVVGTSTGAENGAAFPHSGLTPALGSAMRAEIDLLLLSDCRLLGSGLRQKELAELFQSYGVSIKSASNCGISSS